MTNILLLLAVLGMVIGVYAVAMPTLTRRGWRLPFASFFSDVGEGEDIEFKTPFEMPRVIDAPLVVAPLAAAPVDEVVPLPPVLRPEDIDEDDPTLTPLFQDLVAEVEAQPLAVVAVPGGPAAEHQPPSRVLVHSESAESAEARDTAVPESVDEELQPEAPASESNEMLALFEESSDAGKGPNLVRELSGDIAISELMEEVRKLRELLDNKRAA